MPAGRVDTPERLSLEARKQLLLIACTIDRLNLMARIPPPATSPFVTWAGGLHPPAWLGMALGAATRLLPVKYRVLTTLLRLWRPKG